MNTYAMNINEEVLENVNGGTSGRIYYHRNETFWNPPPKKKDKEDTAPSSIIDPDSTTVFQRDAMVTIPLYDGLFGPIDPTAFFTLD